jgi:hypothetical protein
LLLKQLRRVGESYRALSYAHRKPIWWICAAAVIATFIAQRLFLWSGYFVPIFTPDSQGYFDEAYRLAHGTWPHFAVRTPGYPIVLLVVLGAFDSILAVIITQQVATLVAALFLLWSLWSVSLSAWPLALLAAVGFASSPETAYHEMLLMPDHLYAVALVAAASSLILGIYRHDWKALTAGSVWMALAIYLRPAGLFLVVLWLILLVALAALRRSKLQLIALALPLPVLLLTLCLYNLATIERFTVSPWGSANFVAATATFWKQSDRFSARVNAAIAKSRELLTDADRELLAKSWRPWELFPVYDKAYNPALYRHLMPAVLGEDQTAVMETYQQKYLQAVAVLNRVAVSAVKESPIQYVKFVFTNLWIFLFDRARKINLWHYSNWMEYVYLDLFVRRSICSNCPASFRRYMLREFEIPNGNMPRHIRTSGLEPAPLATIVDPSPQLTFSLRFLKLFRTVYSGQGWPICFSALTIFVIFRVLWKRRTSDAELCLLTLSLMLIGAAAVVSLVELALYRYSYPTYFINYTGPAMLAALLFPDVPDP